MTAAEPSTTRGPLDPRVVALSPAIRTHAAVCAAAAVATTVAVLVQAEAIARELPRMIAGHAEAVGPLVVPLLVVAAVRAAAAFAIDRSATRTAVEVRTTVRDRILDHLAVVTPDQRGELGAASVATLTTTAIDALDPWIRTYLPGLALAVVLPLAAGVRILTEDLLSAAILVVVVPLIPVFMVLIGRATEHHADRQWDALQRLAQRFLDVVTGMATLRLFGRADAQVGRVREVTERYRAATVRTLRIAFLSALVLELIATLTVALVAVSIGIRLTHGDLTLQTGLIVLLLVPECLLPIRRVGAAFHAATAGVDAATEIAEALALPVRPAGTIHPPAGDLVIEAASVDDPRRGARLAPCTVAVSSGELVAVTGPSGAGKSTLLDVARGALALTSGSASLGGVPVAQLDPVERAAAIRWVSQRPSPVGRSIAGTVALGHASGPATDAGVDAALGSIGLGEVRDLPPRQASGGELRRAALARALVAVELGTVQHLLVDEPTAQLDRSTGEAVIAALRSAADRGVGVLVATHDPALIAAADRRVEVTAGHVAPTAAPLPARAAHHRADPTAPHLEPLAVPTPTSTAAAIDRPASAGARAGTPDTATRGAADDGAERSELGAAGTGAIRWLLRTSRPQRARLLGAQALGVLTETCAVGLTATAAWLIVRAAERPNFADLAVAAVAVRAFGVGKGALRYAERMASHDATLRLLAELRATVVARLAHLSPTGLPDGGGGDLLARLVDDIDRLQDLFLRVLAPLTSTLVVAAGATTVALAIDPPSGFVVGAGALAVGVGLPWATYRVVRAAGHQLGEVRGGLTAATVDLAEHAEELVAIGADPTWRNEIDRLAERVDVLEHRRGRATALVAAAGAGAPAAVAAGVVWSAGPAGPGLSGPALGVLVLLALATLELLAPASATGEVLARVEASARRVKALLDRPDPVVEPAVPAAAPATASLELRGVSLAWPGGPIQVDGIDLSVGPGERVVVAGPSGSGKSTLAAALVRFLAPVSGTYAVGSVPASELGGEGVRRIVTWCQQTPWFADSTLGDNLRIARPTATDDELWAVLATVHLDDWAHRLPDGLDTRLAHDADAMSGGERQRLALGRALLGGHGTIVLDEPTAHLDEDTAGRVMTDLLSATAEQAVVLISHDAADRALGPVHLLVPTPSGPSRWTVPVS